MGWCDRFEPCTRSWPTNGVKDALQAAIDFSGVVAGIVSSGILMGFYFSIGAERKNTDICVVVGL
jgi:hypothetical protein